ncbi:thioredoxin-like protein [Amylostereum chailletii]|nr:thioredoxin-like protein [Amylostereum chailletii]
MPVANTTTPLTVVELFQSQGCSSCPPANANVLALIDTAPDALVLTYEVTYWDYLGWPDTFARKAWDDRQREYSAAFHNRSVYTPQVIVNGLANGVGSRKSELQSLLREGQAASPLPTGPLSVTLTSPNHITVRGPADARALVQLVLYDPTTHDVAIARGENGGRTIPHRNVVRELVVLGWWEGGELSFALPERPADGLNAAILVQKGRGGPVLGAVRV